MRNTKGITLIALIITIIVLLILAGVAIASLTHNNGILNQANKVVNEYVKATMKEELELEIMKLRIEYETDERLKEIYPTIGDYIKDKLNGYQFSNGSVVKYNEEEDKFSFNIEGEEATFQISNDGNIINLTFSGTTSGGNQKDTIPPVVNVVSTTTNSITFYATDNIGIVGYAVTETNKEPTQWEQVEKTQELEKTITGLVNNKTYYVWTKDEVGNMSEVQMVKTIDFARLEHNISWSGTKATITITTPTSGVQYRIDSLGNWNNYVTPITVDSGTTIQFIITDGTNVTTATTIIPRLEGLQLTYDVNTGTGSVPASRQYTHEDMVTVSFSNLPTKTGYIFSGWSTNSKASSAEYKENGTKTFKMPANNVTLYAIWMPDTGTAYKVIHRQMNVTGSGYTTVATENLTGTTGTSITPVVNSYIGFTAPEPQTTTIVADGSTTVTYDYTRNQYRFTLESTAEVDTTGSSPTGNYYYEAPITLKASTSLDYSWDRWIGSDSSFSTTTANTIITMPASNLTMHPYAVPKAIETAKEAKTVFKVKTELADKYGNTVVVPEGFKIAEDSAIDVTGGVVIEDVSHGATEGSQFVWVPVSRQLTEGKQKIKGETKEVEINLGRYYFANDGTPNDYSYSDDKEEDSRDIANLLNYGNTIAKDVEAFKSSVNNNGRILYRKI